MSRSRDKTARSNSSNSPAEVLSAVALLSDLSKYGLVRGQVGKTVEALDEATALVEFSDDSGRA